MGAKGPTSKGRMGMGGMEGEGAYLYGEGGKGKGGRKGEGLLSRGTGGGRKDGKGGEGNPPQKSEEE